MKDASGVPPKVLIVRPKECVMPEPQRGVFFLDEAASHVVGEGVEEARRCAGRVMRWVGEAEL